LAALARAQAPDIQAKVDLLLHDHSEAHGDTTLRFYDTFGHFSTVAFQLALEPGLKAYISQRIQRIRHDGDPSQLDEYYVEDPGNWRIGKQYLPFGSGNIIRESVLAVRAEHFFLLNDVPVSVAACDAGMGRQRGVVGRLGNDLGFSFYFGRHFGINASSLTYVRQPEDSSGVGAGYKSAFAVDASKKSGITVLGAEYVQLRDGEGQDAGDRDLLDLSVSLKPSNTRSLTLGWTWVTHPGFDIMRLQNSFQVAQNTSVEAFIRMKHERFYDFGVSLRVKL
jgi:hypothetical protein